METKIYEAKTFEEAVNTIVEISNSKANDLCDDKDENSLILLMKKFANEIDEQKKKLEKEIASRDSKEVNEVFINDFRTNIEWLFRCTSAIVSSIKNSWKESDEDRSSIERLELLLSLIASKAMQTINVLTFKSLRINKTAKRMISIYQKKNADYGNSFDQSLDEDGLLVAKIRIGDKVRRFLSLTKEGVEVQVKEESISDTLLDLANYCVMTIVYINNHKN